HAAVERGDDDLRDVDVGEQIDGHSHETRHSDNDDDEADNDDEVGIAKREPGHYFSPAAAAFAFGITTAPALSCARLPTTTRSPVFTPRVTSMRSSASSPSVTLRSSIFPGDRPSPLTTSTRAPFSVRSTACTGATSVSFAASSTSVASAYMPGTSSNV